MQCSNILSKTLPVLLSPTSVSLRPYHQCDWPAMFDTLIGERVDNAAHCYRESVAPIQIMRLYKLYKFQPKYVLNSMMT